MKRFENKVAVVTGAASGIGRATAERLASEGARVACVDVVEAGLAETASRVERSRASVLTVVGDISDEAAVQRTISAVLERFSRIDVVCNVAGILRADHTHELGLEDWSRVIAVNLTGTFLMCRAALPSLIETKGAIVNMGSTAALGAHPWMAAYSASKGGILAMTRSMAVEYVKHGVRVNAVCPGGVVTPLHGQFQLPEGADSALLRRALPHAEYGTPAQIAATIAFLASSDAEYITGAELRVDGGALS